MAVVEALVGRLGLGRLDGESIKVEQAPSATATATGGRAVNDSRNVEWSATIGWRVITYRAAGISISFQIEPMVSGSDLVYVPDADTWKRLAPTAYRDRRAEVLGRLKGVRWNRSLKWEDAAAGFTDGRVIPGSLESTKGGAEFEAKNLFAPGCELTFEQARELWILIARRFAQGVRGKVTIFADTLIPNSVFKEIELPDLRANPQATLEFR